MLSLALASGGMAVLDALAAGPSPTARHVPRWVGSPTCPPTDAPLAMDREMPAGCSARVPPRWARPAGGRAAERQPDLQLPRLVQRSNLIEFFCARLHDRWIAKLPKAFSCVATDLATGREVWLTEGSVIDTVRASSALPACSRPAARTLPRTRHSDTGTGSRAVVLSLT